MPRMTMLDRVIVRAANDETFRKALLTDPDSALASMDCVLNDYEHAVIDEYRRVANQMDEEQQLQDEISDCPAKDHSAPAGP